jgi:hypothetical protein
MWNKILQGNRTEACSHMVSLLNCVLDMSFFSDVDALSTVDLT